MDKVEIKMNKPIYLGQAILDINWNILIDIGLKHFNDPKAFIEYSNNMHHVYQNIDHYNPDKENKIVIVFDDVIADMINNKNLNSIITELFIRGRKLNIPLVFVTQLYFKVPKDVRLNILTFSL